MNLPRKVSFAHPNHWEPLWRARNDPPPTDVAAIQWWINVQHVESPLDRLVGQAVDRTIREHVGTTEAWLAVSGEKHLGKSDTLGTLALQRSMSTSTGWRRRQPNHHLYIPYVFVELSERPSAKSILRASCRFLGLDTGGNDDDLKWRLTEVAPNMGLQAIIIDEAQNLRRASREATTSTDGLRSLTHLPVPVIFTGLNLQTSALLRHFNTEGDSVEQLVERGRAVLLEPYDKNTASLLAPLIRCLHDRLAAIDGFTAPALRENAALAAVAKYAGFRPGATLEVIKKAASAAIERDRALTVDLLAETMSRVDRRSGLAAAS